MSITKRTNTNKFVQVKVEEIRNFIDKDPETNNNHQAAHSLLLRIAEICKEEASEYERCEYEIIETGINKLKSKPHSR